MRTGAWATVDLAAIRHNVEWLRSVAAPAPVWAIVKADGYGHGSVEVARAALEAGAEGLGVALVSEGAVLRHAGIEAPILLLSEPPAEELASLVALGLEATVYTAERITQLGVAVQRGTVRVHLKVDTGMHRVGAAPDDVVALASMIDATPALEWAALWTHCAVADAPDDPFTQLQLERLDRSVADLVAAGLTPPRVHAANSAGAIAHPGARRDFVRAGIAVYGIWPSPEMQAMASALRPALSLRSRVSLVRELEAGEALSYGLRYRFARDAVVATIPIGYADGVPRRLFATGGEVLIGGRRRAIAGVVTMDQLMVDCGDDHDVRRGDEVVLIGRQGDDEITATEWAQRLGTIGYEIVCGISARVPRRYVP